MGSLMWAALALPILVSGLGLLRPPHRTGVRRAVFIACLVVSLLWNIGLSVFTFYLGIGFDPTVAISTRVLSLLVAGTSVVLTAGIVSALRSSQPGWRRHLIHPS